MTKKTQILSVAYDEALLLTREYLLQQAGFTVTSALGYAQSAASAQQGDYHLLMLGHTVVPNDKTALIAIARKACDCVVLSIYRHGYPPHPDADVTVDANDGPEALIQAVKKALSS